MEGYPAVEPHRHGYNHFKSIDQFMGQDPFSNVATCSTWAGSAQPQFQAFNYFPQQQPEYMMSRHTAALMTPSPSSSEISDKSSPDLQQIHSNFNRSQNFQAQFFQPDSYTYDHKAIDLQRFSHVFPDPNCHTKLPPQNMVQELDHLSAQRKSRRCKCPNCDAPKDSGSLGTHQKAEKKKHVCYFAGCGKVYGKTSHLKAHIRWHEGIRPFHCTFDNCGKNFTRSDELSRHVRTHTGEKRFQCEQCNKAFTRSDHLSKHKKVHTKEAAGDKGAKRGRKSHQKSQVAKDSPDLSETSFAKPNFVVDNIVDKENKIIPNNPLALLMPYESYLSQQPTLYQSAVLGNTNRNV